MKIKVTVKIVWEVNNMKRIFDVFKFDKNPDDSSRNDKPSTKRTRSVKEDKTNSAVSTDSTESSFDESKKDDAVKNKKAYWGKDETRSSYIFPKVTKKKLTIVLLENTKKSIEEKATILKIIHRLVSTDLICVITYGDDVNVYKVKKVSEFSDEKLLDMDNVTENACCLYDALITLNKVVTIAYKRELNEDFGIDRYKIDSIDIIGIGSGLNVGSKTKIEEAIKCFDKILEKKDIDTKYFCFSEDTFKDVALLGFRSIGAFPSKKV